MSDDKKKKPFKYPAQAPGVQHMESGEKTGKSETGSSAIRGSARRFGLEDTADDDAEPIGMSSGRKPRQPSDGLNSSLRSPASQGLYPRISEVHATGAETSSDRGFGQFGAVAVPGDDASTSEQASVSSTVAPRAMPPSRLLDNRDRRTVEDPTMPQKGGLAFVAPGQAPANSTALSGSHSPGLGSQNVAGPTSVSQETTPTNSSRAVARRSDGASQVGAIAVAGVGAGVGAPPRSSAETVVAEAVTADDALADDIRNQLREELREEIQRTTAAIPSAEVVQQGESQGLAGGAGLDSTSSGDPKPGFWTSKRLWIAATAVLLVAVGALVAALLASGGSGGGDTAASNQQDNQGPREVPGAPSSPPVDNPTFFGNPTFVPPSPSLPPSPVESPANLPTQTPAADVPTSTGAPMSPTSSPAQFPTPSPAMGPTDPGTLPTAPPTVGSGAPIDGPTPTQPPTQPPTFTESVFLSPFRISILLVIEVEIDIFALTGIVKEWLEITFAQNGFGEEYAKFNSINLDFQESTSGRRALDQEEKRERELQSNTFSAEFKGLSVWKTTGSDVLPSETEVLALQLNALVNKKPQLLAKLQASDAAGLGDSVVGVEADLIEPTDPPTPFPTPFPTPPPVEGPTNPPTPRPTPFPTIADTPPPTRRPTPRPTPFPIADTPPPTRRPTPRPTTPQIPNDCKKYDESRAIYCSATSSSCTFYVALNGRSCNDYCRGEGGECLRAQADANDGCETNGNERRCSDVAANDDVCTCSRGEVPTRRPTPRPTPSPTNGNNGRNCKDKYGSGILVCRETSSSCTFLANLGGKSCASYCRQRGGSCRSAYQDLNDSCVNNGSATCNDEANDNVCECTL